jgi:hypothetical protein
MRIDIANSVNVGDTIYNCFKNPLKVAEKKVTYSDNGRIDDIVFTTVDNHEESHIYDYVDLYLKDMEDENDIEKAWVEWASKNQDFLYDFDHITTIKEIYSQAFADGFEHKRRYSYEEQMQK